MYADPSQSHFFTILFIIFATFKVAILLLKCVGFVIVDRKACLLFIYVFLKNICVIKSGINELKFISSHITAKDTWKGTWKGPYLQTKSSGSFQ